MKSFRRIVVALVIIAAVASFALIPGTMWLNSFIHSDSFRKEVETKAGQAVGGKVEIKQIDFSILSGVTLSGLATKLTTEQGTVAAQVDSVSCSYSLLALLSRKLQFDSLTAVKPEIVLTQQAPSTVATPPTPAVPANNATPAQTASGKTALFAVVLDSARISNGHLSIRDADGAPKADLQGVQVSADTSGYYNGKDITGKLRIATVVLPQNLSLTNFSTPFTYRTGAMSAAPFEADAFSGKLNGSYHLDPGSPSQLEVDATGLDIAKIGKTANPNSSSTLTGSLALQSKWQGAETGKLTGEGDAQITHGKLNGVSALNDLAGILRINELRDPVLKSVKTHFSVANGTTHFTDLRIESPAFVMTGHGVIDPKGNLDAEMSLTIGGARLPGGVGSIPFHLGGTVSSPHADINPASLLQAPKVEKTVNKALNHLFH